MGGFGLPVSMSKSTLETLTEDYDQQDFEPSECQSMGGTVVDLNELQRALNYIEYVNGLNIETFSFVRDGQAVPAPYTEADVKDWKFVGLSNVCFIGTYGLTS